MRAALRSHIIGILIFASSLAYPAANIWTGGGGNSSWSNINNWSLGRVPNATDDATISLAAAAVVMDYNYAGAAIHGLILSGAGSSLTLQFPLATSTNANISAGTLTTGNNTLTIDGNLTLSGGTLNFSGATGIGTMVEVSGTVSGTAGSAINAGGAGRFRFHGATVNLTNIAYTPGSTELDFVDGPTSFTSAGKTIAGLRVGTSAGLAGNVTLVDPLAISGAAGLGAISAASGGGTLSCGANQVTITTGNVNLTNISSFTTGGGFTFNGTSTITSAGLSFHDVTVNTAGTVTLGSALIATGNLNITAGTLDVSAGNYQIDVVGNWSNSGTFTARAGTVRFVNTGAATITPGGSPFWNLEIANTAGVSNYSYLLGALTVSNSMTIAATGDIGLNGNNITVSGTFSNSGMLGLTGTETVSLTMDTAKGTVWYYDNTSRTINTYFPAYYNLLIDDFLGASSPTLTLSAAGNVTVNGDLLLSTGYNTSNLNTNNKNVTVLGNVAVTAGGITAGSSTITVGGNWSNSGTFTAGTSTVVFNGGVTQNVTPGASSFNNVTINGAATVVDFGGNSFTLATLSNNGTLALDGSQATTTITTMDTDSGLVRYEGAAGGTVRIGSFYDLEINGAGTFGLNAAKVVNRNLTITAGTLDVSLTNYQLTVSGSWSNSGSFSARAGTVVLNTTATASISGSTGFYNLSCTTAGKTLSFQAGATQTVSNTLTVTGASGNLIRLLSATPGAQWTFSLTSAETVTWAFVQDGAVVGGFNITASTSTNGGNNDTSGADGYWVFPGATAFTWTGASSTNWDYGGNWSTGYVPNPGDSVTIGAGANQPLLGRAVTVASVTINNAAGNLSTGGYNFTVAGALTVSAGKVTTSAGETISAGGNVNFTGGSFTPASSTLTITGTSTVTMPSSLYNFTVNASGLTVTLGAALTATNDLTITGGTLDVSASNYQVTVGDNWSNSGTFTARGGTVVLNGGGAQSVTAGGSAFNALTMNKAAGTATLGSAVVVGTNLTITAGAFDVSASNYQVTVGGNWSNSGTFTARGGTVAAQRRGRAERDSRRLGFQRADREQGRRDSDPGLRGRREQQPHHRRRHPGCVGFQLPAHGGCQLEQRRHVHRAGRHRGLQHRLGFRHQWLDELQQLYLHHCGQVAELPGGGHPDRRRSLHHHRSPGQPHLAAQPEPGLSVDHQQQRHHQRPVRPGPGQRHSGGQRYHRRRLCQQRQQRPRRARPLDLPGQLDRGRKQQLADSGQLELGCSCRGPART